MAIVLDGTTGITTPDLDSGPVSGTIGTFSGAVSGTTGTFSGALQASGVNTNIYPLVSGTAVASTSGTAIDFTGIPSWVKRITVMFSGVSTNGTSNVQLQIGSLSGGFETSGYAGSSTYWATSLTTGNLSTGFTLIDAALSAAAVRQGSITLNNLNANTWVCNGIIGRSDNIVSVGVFGQKTLSNTLDRIRITTVNGTDTFDAGTINIMWE